MLYNLLLHCCQSRNSACPVVALRRYMEYKKHVKLIIRYLVITRKGGRLDLADVQHILELDCFSVHLFAGWKCSPRQPVFSLYLLCASSSLWCISSPGRFDGPCSPRWTPSPTALNKQPNKHRGRTFWIPSASAWTGWEKILNDWGRWKGGHRVKQCHAHK